MKWFEITQDILPAINQIRTVKIEGKSFCLINNEGEFHATSLRCPHAGANLSSGWCEENRLICPFHRHAFDLKTGKGDPGQGNFIRIYPLKKEHNKLYVGFQENWFKRIFK